jgi:hypothetical protein
MPDERKWIGICLLCGDDLYLDNVIPDSNYTHNCERGRILHFQGSSAYQAWLDERWADTYREDLEQFQREIKG